MASAGFSTGLGLWVGTGTNLPDQFGTGGKKCDVLIDINGRVGIQTFSPTEALDVTGNILASGSITGATKSFEIPHPDPSKSADSFQASACWTLVPLCLTFRKRGSMFADSEKMAQTSKR